MNEAVGFVGLGVMGARMVRRLLADGYLVTAWVRDGARAELLAQEELRFVNTPREVAEACTTVVGCLLDDEAVRRVYEGADGLISGSRAGHTFIEHGTFSPDYAVELSGRLSENHSNFIDAPVTGGPEGAAAGTLIAMVGGDLEAVNLCRTLFSSYLESVHYIGASGAGLRLKLVNQFLVSVHIAAAVEAAAILEVESINLETALPVLMGGWAASAMLERELPLAMHGEFDSQGATIRGLVPVQNLVVVQFETAGIRSRMLPAVYGLFREAIRRGVGSDDPARLVDFYRQGDS